MGKNIYIQADAMTDEEEQIGDFRGWHTGGDVFLSHAEAEDPDQKRRDEEDFSYYAGPYVMTSDAMRALIPEAQAVEREEWGDETDAVHRVTAFVDLWATLEREGRHPTLWVCV